MYSQNNEDDIIQNIFAKIGEGNRTFLEIGAGDGTECNTRALREKGWTGVAFDMAHENDHVEKVFATNKESVGMYSYVCGEASIDLLSIDIDSNDYYILYEILRSGRTPRAICIEYNKHFGDKNIVMGYDEGYEWDGESTDYGASKTALIKLCEHYGYKFWGTDVNEVNCFFVLKNELK